MIKYKKVLCDIMECTEYEYKSRMSSTLSDSKGNVIAESGFGVSSYDGKPIHKNVPFIQVSEPYYYLYIPEEKFNFITKFLIVYSVKFKKGITLNNKRFYKTSPNKIGDVYVKCDDED